MSQPLVPPDADLRGFPFFPLYRARLFASTFHVKANDGEWRAGVTLWLKSWDQVPAGSLPNDDAELCHLADLGRDLKRWRKLRAMALHGWKVGDDGRLYHHTVAEYVNAALVSKQSQQDRTAAARAARHKLTNGSATTSVTENVTTSVTDNVTITPILPPDPLSSPLNRTEQNGLSPPIVPPSRGGRGARRVEQKSPRVVQIEAFAHAAAERQRHC